MITQTSSVRSTLMLIFTAIATILVVIYLFGISNLTKNSEIKRVDAPISPSE